MTVVGHRARPMEISQQIKIICSIRLVFTSDRVVVGVVLRSEERYDLVKIKPTESEHTDSAYDSIAYDQVKTALSESQEEAEE